MKRQRDRELSRREFVVLGSTSLLATAVLGPHLFSQRSVWEVLAAPYRPASRSFSVGYWRGSEFRSDFDRIIPASSVREVKSVPQASDGDSQPASVRSDMMPAESLPAGDPRFVQTAAWMTIHGLFEAEKPFCRTELEGLSVEVPFEILERGEAKRISCAAWQYDKHPVLNLGSPVRLRVPLDSMGHLQLSVESRDGALGLPGRVYKALVFGKAVSSGETPAVARGEIRFSVGQEPDLPKLRRGVYVISLLDQGYRREPAWEQWQFRQARGSDTPEARQLVRKGVDGLEPAVFDYLVVSVDYEDTASRLQA